MARAGRKAANQVLLTALAFGATVENAAHKAGISERTVYRRLKDSTFRRELEQVRADMVDRIAGLLTAAGVSSVKALVDTQQDASTTGAARRGAARDILAMGLKYRDAATLEKRLAAVEERLGSGQPIER